MRVLVRRRSSHESGKEEVVLVRRFSHEGPGKEET